MMQEEPNEASRNSSYPKKVFNGPVYFLIREQAKSVVAIQELQVRLTLLEDLQQRLMQAVHNVQHHLISGKTGCSDIQRDNLGITSSLAITHQLTEPCPPGPDIKQQLIDLVPAAKNDSKGESINKDSGVVSDYKETCSESSYVPFNSSERVENENDDELLKLLDIIDQKSLILLQQVEDIGSKTMEASETNEVNICKTDSSYSNHYAENVITQRQLCEVKADRDELKNRLVKLEIATDTVVREKKKLQKKLENVVTENEQLQMKIKSASNVTHFNADCGSPYTTKSSIADIQKALIRRKYMQYSEKSRKKVAAVLKETHVLELQRQLLTYIMENDVLQAKLEQSQPSNFLAWLQIESRLKKELQNTNEEKKLLEKALREKTSEVSNLKTRIRVLEENLEQEKAMKNFGLGSTEDWREPSGQNLKGNLNALSPLGFGDFSKTQSLPAVVRLDTGADAQNDQVTNLGNKFSTENFIDISLNHSSSSDVKESNFCNNASKEKNLLDLTDGNDSEISNASTLLNIHYWTHPTISADWSIPGSLTCNQHRSNTVFNTVTERQNSLTRDVSAKLVNGHLCWKGNISNSNELDSICTEFDPLSSSLSCENFVDSLNLSIPLKPTQVVSQLSSIGDSLHSASLDLGCASSAMWQNDNQKLSSANSVDGIRKLLIESGIPNFYKNPISTNTAHSNTTILSGKAVHSRSLNKTGSKQF